ncbi:MAG: FKBP-type peptidyl-prolyl cis-trans isomerase [Bacteroidales bacterium]|nr:FKBP-type peptidyl-prolyl cis-trans isomerase [Bacteroidales bacterium]
MTQKPLFSYTFFLLSIVTSFLITCCSPNTYNGYTLKQNGIYFQLHKFGDSDIPVTENSVVTFHISYATPDDSIFFEAIRRAKIEKPPFQGSIEECFLMLNEGDSASFLINADLFYHKTLQQPLPPFLPNNSYLKVNLQIISVKSLEIYEQEKKEFLAWIEDFGEYEKAVLKKYLKKRNIPYDPNDTAVYKIQVNKGNNPCIQYGDTVIMHYEGYFLNGKLFDSTRKRKEPFLWIAGTEWQLIKGLEKAVLAMCNGEKSIFIIPSALAFGKTGSSTGIIPPYTSVVFEVEIIYVGKANL